MSCFFLFYLQVTILRDYLRLQLWKEEEEEKKLFLILKFYFLTQTKEEKLKREREQTKIVLKKTDEVVNDVNHYEDNCEEHESLDDSNFNIIDE